MSAKHEKMRRVCVLVCGAGWCAGAFSHMLLLVFFCCIHDELVIIMMISHDVTIVMMLRSLLRVAMLPD